MKGGRVMRKVMVAVMVMILAVMGPVGLAGAEDWKFLAGGDYDPHNLAFSQVKRVAIEVIVVDLVKNEVLPLDEVQATNLENIKQFMAANMKLKEAIAVRLEKEGMVSVSQYPEPVMVLREALRQQLTDRGFVVVKEGTPDVFRLKIYGAQKGTAPTITRFLGIVVDGIDKDGKMVFSYNAGALYSAISSSQDEMIKQKIAPSLARLLGDAFNRVLVRR